MTTPALPRIVPLLLAAVALSLAAAGDGVLPGDVAVARAVQRVVLPWGADLVRALTWLGRAFPGTLALTVLVVAVLLRKRRTGAAVLVAATLPLRLVNPVLKALIDSPRPTASAVQLRERAEGLGFPSGHASGALLFFGAVIVVAPLLVANRRACQLLRLGAGLMILATGVARVASGAHWPSDVLGGVLWGGLLLSLLSSIAARPRAARPRR